MSIYQAKKPEDVIPDGESYFEQNGQRIRKGTMAAAIANADILESEDATKEEKAEAMKVLEVLAPILNAVGLNKHVCWKNPQIQAAFDKADKR